MYEYNGEEVELLITDYKKTSNTAVMLRGKRSGLLGQSEEVNIKLSKGLFCVNDNQYSKFGDWLREKKIAYRVSFKIPQNGVIYSVYKLLI